MPKSFLDPIVSCLIVMTRFWRTAVINTLSCSGFVQSETATGSPQVLVTAAKRAVFVVETFIDCPPALLYASTAVELSCSGQNGLLSPTLSSRGGEGEDREGTCAKCLNSIAVLY